MYGQYLSPAAASIYIGHLHLDDCYAIKYCSEESAAPLYQYDQPHYSSVAPGKVLVSGSIAIVSRYPGYLTMALKKAADAAGDSGSSYFEENALRSRQLIDWLEKMKSADTKTKFNLLADAARQGPEFLKEASALAWLGSHAYDQLTPESIQQISLAAEAQKKDGTNIDLDTNIWIYYDELDGYAMADKLEGVVFLGVAKALSAAASPAGDVSASGVPIIEIYPFFARRATQLVLNPKGWSPS